MPYEYNKLSQKERDELVKTRRQRGYPLHGPPHPFRMAGYYLITAANYNHIEIMLSPQRRDCLEKRLMEALSDVNAELCGWVILANHYHFLAGVKSLEQISSTLKRLHNGTSFEWNREDGLTGSRRVWYRFSDRYIRNDQQYYQSLNYIHYNPCKHGYVQDPYEWKWSSLDWYYGTQGREWLCDRWKEYPIKGFGEGWDEYKEIN